MANDDKEVVFVHLAYILMPNPNPDPNRPES